MRLTTVFMAIGLAVLALPDHSSARCRSCRNIPAVTAGWQDKFWMHPDGTKCMAGITRNSAAMP
jgi:hypothetical protein